VASRGSENQLDHALGDIAHINRLKPRSTRDDSDWGSGEFHQEHQHQVVKLGGAQDGPRQSGVLDAQASIPRP
jgi:hypothetical protein